MREARTVPFSATAPEDDDSEPAVAPDRFGTTGMWTSPPARWDDGTPERLVSDRQSLALIGQALEALPERQRIVLTLRDIEGLDADEVRNILGVSETNQRVLLHRARSKVRSELERLLARG